jgi:hypothetical protein
LAKPAKQVDLATFDPLVKAQEEGRECQIVHPLSGLRLSVKISVVGRDSRRFKAANRWLTRRQLERIADGGVDGDDANQDDLCEFLARLCTGWSGVIVDGEELAFSVENATKVFKRFPFTYEQVDAFSGTRLNFTGG